MSLGCFLDRRSLALANRLYSRMIGIEQIRPKLVAELEGSALGDGVAGGPAIDGPVGGAKCFGKPGGRPAISR